MLTGDKGATARMIGIQCGLIPQASLQLKTKERSNESILIQIKETSDVKQLLEDFDRAKGLAKDIKFQITIEGQTMSTIFHNEEVQAHARHLLLSADAVILYRSSPSQKAELTTFMRKLAGLKKRICTIGDGANDVLMLQRANVGIGIMGREGN